ncbi:hypothetical protein BI350_03300 [Sporosarcina ureilytica]|uniref:Transposase n=2 Tax=Sporosarcina ureilytica TaxID=298596 RepID=A0A1D8JDD4_9BACL|nr:hypothetical protein BI350_03300 [Sporosarcina ureilytica]
MKDETLREAFENWEVLSGTKEEVMAYKARVKQLFDEESMILEAELRVKEGIEKGIKQGLEQGIVQGTEKTARQLLAMGMEIDFIAEATGLSKERISEINH